MQLEKLDLSGTTITGEQFGKLLHSLRTIGVFGCEMLNPEYIVDFTPIMQDGKLKYLSRSASLSKAEIDR